MFSPRISLDKALLILQRIRPNLVDKAQKILSALEAANAPEDMALPMFRVT